MEIERKFLMDKMPTELTPLECYQIEQGYLSINPEVRIRRKKDRTDESYKITIKSDGDLAREEIEMKIDYYQYAKLKEMINLPMIQKDYYIYRIRLPRDKRINEYTIHDLEFSIVDKGTPNEFMYAEIEFFDEEDANEYIPDYFLGKEVTYDPNYKMKNYWVRTRLEEKE